MNGGKLEDPVRSNAADLIENLKSTDAEVDLTRLSEQLKLSETSSHLKEQEVATSRMDMPDAIMFCCPMLNLSPDLSPSRIVGNSDPVLPSSLLRAISDSYVPEKGIKEDIASTLVERADLPYHEGIDHSKCQVQDAKKNPLVSPFFASDDVLRFFPPTLLYGSSEDPFLDDSVSFNARLRSLGVESDLRATMHMAHAFWGLGKLSTNHGVYKLPISLTILISQCHYQ
jgi:acetyl esterase/lipase